MSLSKKRQLDLSKLEPKIINIFQEISQSLLKKKGEPIVFELFESFVNENQSLDKHISSYKKEYLDYMFNHNKSDFIKGRWADTQVGKKKLNLKLPSKLKDIDKIKEDTSVLDLYFILFIALRWKGIDIQKYKTQNQSPFILECEHIESLSEINFNKNISPKHLDTISEENFKDINYFILLYLPLNEGKLLQALHDLSNSDPLLRKVLLRLRNKSQYQLHNYVSAKYSEFQRFDHLFKYIDIQNKQKLINIFKEFSIPGKEIYKLAIDSVSNYSLYDNYDDVLPETLVKLGTFIKNTRCCFYDLDLTSLILYIHTKNNNNTKLINTLAQEYIIEEIRNVIHLFTLSLGLEEDYRYQLEQRIITETLAHHKPGSYVKDKTIRELKYILPPDIFQSIREIASKHHSEIKSFNDILLHKASNIKKIA